MLDSEKSVHLDGADIIHIKLLQLIKKINCKFSEWFLTIWEAWFSKLKNFSVYFYGYWNYSENGSLAKQKRSNNNNNKISIHKWIKN